MHWISLYLCYYHEKGCGCYIQDESRLAWELFCFQVFRFSLSSDFLNLLLVRFNQAKITIVKHDFFERRNNEACLL